MTCGLGYRMASSTGEASRAGERSPARFHLDDVWTLFGLAWGASVLFHLAGNPRLAPEWGRGLLAGAAVLLVAFPRRPWAALPLSFAVLANIWLEAPTLGNHWLIHGFVALLVIGSVVVGRGVPAASLRVLVPPARLLLLAFYVFAAFAKLNRDFFDPAVSCAVFYLRESAESWGALGLYDALPGSGDTAVAIGVATIELAIPLLLVLRRTRHTGVIVAIAFHWVLAVDRDHQFFDFSSVLTVLFLLFLDPHVAASVVHRVRRLSASLTQRWSSGPEMLRLAALSLAVGTAVTVTGPDRWSVVRPLREVGVSVWMLLGAAVFGLVLAAVRGAKFAEQRLLPLSAAHSSASRWMLIVPALAALNGLTPYLELKSGFGWNMYSNLAVVDGESNHYLIRSGLPLTDGHDRLVEIQSTSDPRLEFYEGGWLLPEHQLLDYLADADGVVVRGTVEGEPAIYRGGEQPARSTLRQKFQLFRAVDADGPTNCQPSFGPAR